MIVYFSPSTDILKICGKKGSQYPIQPLRSKVKNVGFIVKCEECNKSRLFHAKHKLKANGIKGAKRMISTVAYVYGSVLSECMGTGNDKYKKFLQTIYARENISYSSKIELLYYTVDIYIYIYPKFVFTVEYPERVELSEILWSITHNAQSVKTNLIFCAQKKK